MNAFAVTITAPPVGDLSPFVDALGQALNAQEPQIQQLLERLKNGPVTVTKPIPEVSARQVAQQLEALGFKTQLRTIAVEVAPTLTSESVSLNTELNPALGNLTATQAAPRKRTSLSNRILLSTLIPLLVLIAVILGFTGLTLPSTVRQLILEGADQLAIAIGNSIELNDPAGENRRLSLITQQPKVFFVSVKLPDGSLLFRAKNSDDEVIVRNTLTEFVDRNANGGTYQWQDNRAEAFKIVIKQLQSSGQATDASINAIQANVDRTKASAGNISTLEIRQIGFNDQNGVRQVAPLSQATFVVSVGVIANDSLRIRDDFLLVFGIVALLATVVIVVIMSSALRRVVQPILEMSKIADRISTGEIDQPVPNFGNDELGDLSQSIDRLRISVKVLVDRMRSKRS